MKRVILLLLVFAVLVNVLPVWAFANGTNTSIGATEETTTMDRENAETVTETEWEEFEVLTSGQVFASFSLGADGKPEITDSNEVEWIDRLKDLPDYAIDFYDWLVENSDGDGVEDALIDPYMGTNVKGAYAYPVVVFEDVSADFSYPANAGTQEIQERALSAVSEAVQENYYTAAQYIVAVYSAFDRDYPEVFWLSGTSRYGYSASYSYSINGAGSGKVYCTEKIYFYLRNTDGYDVRHEDYQNPELIQSVIAERDSRIDEIVSGIAGNRLEKIKSLNNWLTTSNCYNSSADLYNIGHNCRECISALRGTTGTEGPVCEAYARAFSVLCDEMDIPCVLVSGNSDGGEPHMWNYVQMEDGNWYAVDVTWNDPTVTGVTGAVSGAENERYLLVGSDTVIGGKTFAQTHIVNNVVTDGGVAFINQPTLSAEAYSGDGGTDHLPGDINGDGNVTNRDAARLMQYLAGWDVEYVEAALDVNGDGNVTNRDAARLMQYLAGWDVELN